MLNTGTIAPITSVQRNHTLEVIDMSITDSPVFTFVMNNTHAGPSAASAILEAVQDITDLLDGDANRPIDRVTGLQVIDRVMRRHGLANTICGD